MKKEIKERPDWDEFYMFAAYDAATRSSCKYLNTGAVIVKDKRIIASGYNGAPPGIENCLEIGCRKDREKIKFDEKGTSTCRGIHAEVNAKDQVARKDLKGTTLYTLFFPCSSCAKEIVGNGIKEVVYTKKYSEPDSLTNELFNEANVKLRKLEIDIGDQFQRIKRIQNQHKNNN